MYMTSFEEQAAQQAEFDWRYGMRKVEVPFADVDGSGTSFVDIPLDAVQPVSKSPSGETLLEISLDDMGLPEQRFRLVYNEYDSLRMYWAELYSNGWEYSSRDARIGMRETTLFYLRGDGWRRDNFRSGSSIEAAAANEYIDRDIATLFGVQFTEESAVRIIPGEYISGRVAYYTDSLETGDAEKRRDAQLEESLGRLGIAAEDVPEALQQELATVFGKLAATRLLHQELVVQFAQFRENTEEMRQRYADLTHEVRKLERELRATNERAETSKANYQGALDDLHRLKIENAKLRLMGSSSSASSSKRPTSAPSGHEVALGIAPGFWEGLGHEHAGAFLKAVFTRLSAIHHPDTGGSTEKMQQLNAAYEALRSRYGK